MRKLYLIVVLCFIASLSSAGNIQNQQLQLMQQYNAAGGAACTTANDSKLVDYSTATGDYATTNASWIGGEFVNGAAGTFTVTEILIWCVDASSDAGNTVFALHAESDSTGDPGDANASLLDSKSYANSALPDGAAYHTWTLDAPETGLTQGANYYVTSEPDASGETTVSYDGGEDSRRTVRSTNQGATWGQYFASESLRMEIWGCND